MKVQNLLTTITVYTAYIETNTINYNKTAIEPYNLNSKIEFMDVWETFTSIILKQSVPDSLLNNYTKLRVWQFCQHYLMYIYIYIYLY